MSAVIFTEDGEAVEGSDFQQLVGGEHEQIHILLSGQPRQEADVHAAARQPRALWVRPLGEIRTGRVSLRRARGKQAGAIEGRQVHGGADDHRARRARVYVASYGVVLGGVLTAVVITGQSSVSQSVSESVS